MRPGQALSTGASMSVELGCTPKEKHPRMVGVQYATGEESSRKNEEAEPKWKHPLPTTGNNSTHKTTDGQH